MITKAYKSVEKTECVSAYDAVAGVTYYLEDGTRVHVKKPKWDPNGFRPHFVRYPKAYERDKRTKWSPKEMQESLLKGIYAEPKVSDGRNRSSHSSNVKTGESLPYSLRQLHRLRLDRYDWPEYEPFAKFVVYAKYYSQAKLQNSENGFRVVEAQPLLFDLRKKSIIFAATFTVMDEYGRVKWCVKRFVLSYRSDKLFQQQLTRLGAPTVGLPNDSRVLIAGIWEQHNHGRWADCVAEGKTERQIFVISQRS